MTAPLLAWLRQLAPAANAPYRAPFVASRLHRPAWPLLQRVGDLLERFPDTPPGTHAAWEACATEGLIPAEWVDAGRRFVYVPWNGYEEREGPLPPSLSAVAAFAAGAADVAAAEDLLRAHRDAMALWLPDRHDPAAAPRWYAGRQSLSRIWEMGPSGMPDRAAQAALTAAREGALRREFQAIHRFVRSALQGARITRASVRETTGWRLQIDLEHAARWRHAADLGLSVADDGRAVGGRPFASLPDPYAPLVSLWALGFSLTGSLADLCMPVWNVPFL